MRRTRRHKVVRLSAGGASSARSDVLAGEEPMELRVDGRAWTVTMRTPGEDFDLALGFLVSEGVVWDAGHVTAISYGAGVNPDGTSSYNVVDVRLAPGVAPPDTSHERHVYVSSSCGICGTASIDAVTRVARVPVADDVRVPLGELLAMTERLRERQRLFADTGGVHAAGLFRLDDDGRAELLCLREDVGRHNAVDKVIGWALREHGLPLRRCVLQVSGRASFELVQKARMAGIAVLAAVSAPSAMSVELATEAGMTLVAFSRGDSANVYAGAERVLP
ncbi:formate dehydrogenase accessory sulfurtransferase FdhD [Georgenia sp. 311]|uniref:Sulfur carrier protein FdhD n=1 Tax=Georgenia wutianyii TaxID=2585135 RepID=A0ABX5VQG1_9MICO|nr:MULTISPECIES: formate dehydrogenase accessory sulfurtransferase FdhD [Georgenia]QDB80293.1 formate dehydrogenase accessory sulfurtransferase FdhD [Georgenia wutianyii]TNC19033.1 formate dehydrogenase accessory sulfurtransferase FdhD [Georgenia sp. 311]